MTLIELPPLPFLHPAVHTGEAMQDYARLAIAPYKAEIERLQGVIAAYVNDVKTIHVPRAEKAEAERDKLRGLLREVRRDTRVADLGLDLAERIDAALGEHDERIYRKFNE